MLLISLFMVTYIYACSHIPSTTSTMTVRLGLCGEREREREYSISQAPSFLALAVSLIWELRKERKKGRKEEGLQSRFTLKMKATRWSASAAFYNSIGHFAFQFSYENWSN